VEDHPRKGAEGREPERRSSPLRKPIPLGVALVRLIAMGIVVGTVCAFMLGVGARAIYELFLFGWQLFHY